MKTKEWISFRVSPEEYQCIYTHFQQTTCRGLSAYARTVLLKAPVIVKVRNQSADAAIEELIQLKFELSAVGNNLNQATKRLHTLDTAPEMKTWILLNDQLYKTLMDKLHQIHHLIVKMQPLWS